MKAVLMAAGLTAVGLVLGMTSFKTLVNIIYPVSGYIGVVLFGFIAVRNHQLNKQMKAKNEETETEVAFEEEKAV